MIVEKEHLEEGKEAKTSLPITPVMLLISIYLYNTTHNLKRNQTLIPTCIGGSRLYILGGLGHQGV